MTTITRDMIEHTDLHTSKSTIDALIVNYDSKRYLVEIVPDYDSSPADAECYDAGDIEAWSNDQWSYVGVIVTPLDVPESVQFELSDSLWGLEYDFQLNPPQVHNGVTYHHTTTEYQVMHYPAPDMISAVMINVEAYDLYQAKQSFLYS